MVRWAMHSLLWTERFDVEPEPVVKKAKALGFDGIEIYVSPAQIGTFKKAKVMRALQDARLGCIGCTC
jgi:sugar phosphate isomerase/epimerase